MDAVASRREPESSLRSGGRYAHWGIAVVCAILLGRTIPSIYDRQEDGRKAAPNSATVVKIDLNACTYDELLVMPEIGPRIARKILEFRDTHGAFHRPEDLLMVPGIGPAIVEDLRPYVMTGSTLVTGDAGNSTRLR